MRLARAIDASVARMAEGRSRIAVAFSGGLDSSIIALCTKRRTEVVACSAFVEGAVDSSSASRGAAILGIELTATRLTREAVASELRKMDLPFQTSLMDRSLWCLYSIVSRIAAGEGAEVIMLGQLADELFGGYAKYQATLKDDGEEAAATIMDQDVKDYQTRGMVRDANACRRWLEPRFPFAEKEVVDLGRSIPVSFKIRGGVRKAVLREAAMILGVPRELVNTPKRAAQYSSGIQRITR
jgi:asparagine synthase (glutamine-hydrolysing)